MGIFERMGMGWNLAIASFGIIKRNRILLIFPALSTMSLVLIVVSFWEGMSFFGGSIEGLKANHMGYLFLFMFYLINSTVIIFFNMALIHCAFKILGGGEATLEDGIEFSLSRFNVVLSWALISAAFDMILRAIEQRHELITNIVTALFGTLWSLATFLVLPVLAYENLDVIAAIKRSAALFKSTWGERAGAGFSFGIISVGLILVTGLLLWVLMTPSQTVSAFMIFIITWIFLGSIINCVISAAETVFLAVVYQYAAGIPVEGFSKEQLSKIFVPRS